MQSSSLRSNRLPEKCAFCHGKIEERSSVMPDGVPYKYHRCLGCGEEFLDMRQLHDTALIYRQMKRNRVKVSRWGGSLGIRIPKELTEKYHLKANAEVTIVPEKDGFRVLN